MNSAVYEEKRKFNIIDALIIILLVVLILVVVFRSQLIALFIDTGTKANVDIEFVCESIPNEITASVTGDSEIRWVEADVYVGKLILDTPLEKASVLYYDEDNVLKIRKSETHSAFSGKISGTAISNNGCYIDGTDFIAPGMTVTLTNGKVQFTALITNVTFK